VAGVGGALWAADNLLVQALATWGGVGVIRRADHTGAVALTFDDGPSASHTTRICDALEMRGARGTFFVLGRRVEELPAVAGALLERGHQIELHGWRHLNRWVCPPWVGSRDLERGIRSLEETLGIRPLYWRPPWGNCSATSIVATRRLGLRTVRWSLAAEGFWRPRTPEAMAAHVASRLRAGDIVCLHDAGGFAETPDRTLAALGSILSRVAELGLRAVTLSDLLAGA
jgi:peptidoglycan/xylan/chitin deacetylase (PgdA/CDA1 family)